MKNFLQAAGLFVADMASTLIFAILVSVTHDLVLAVSVAVACGIAQIGVQYFRGKPIGAMEWLSLVLVIGSGAASLVTNDPHFVLMKPSVIYLIVGIVMLKPGWLIRYLPQIVRAVSADIATWVGFTWAALMFLSAIVNAVVALNTDVESWALIMAAYGIGSKALVFVLGFAAIRIVTRRRLRALPDEERKAILAASGWPSTPSSLPNPA